jgi:Glycosyltransferase
MIIILTQCFPPAIGGIENLMGGAARHLSARGHNVRVLADGRAFPANGYGDVQYFSGFKPLRNLRKIRALRRLSNSGNVEALLADSWKSLETLGRSGRAEKVGRIVCFAHGNEFPQQANAEKGARIRASLSLSSCIIANSQFTADRVRSYVDDGKIIVRAPAIDGVATVSDEDREWAENCWKNGHPRLLSLARLEPLKGIDQGIIAVKSLIADYPNLRYVIAGAGDDFSRLQKLVEENRLGGHVAFVGVVRGERKSALYSSADVFVMPTRRVGSREEAFGMVYLEAALHGLPVIGGFAGGAREAVIDGQTGSLVDGSSSPAVLEAIRNLLENPPRRKEMSMAAAWFATRFTWSGQIESLEKDLGIGGEHA